MTWFGLRIMMDNDTLMTLLKHLLSLMTHLRCFHDILSGPRVDELLYLSITIINSFLKKEFHRESFLDGKFSNKELLTC